MKLGRKPVRHDARTLTLAEYLEPGLLPVVPPAYDYAAAVPSWPMYGNDRLGDCTVAAAGHMVQAWSTAAGSPKAPAEQAVETMYWRTGIPPADTGQPEGPTDDGRDEISVLNYWRHHGVGGDKIAAYAAIDPSNTVLVQTAIYLFGGVYIGVALPVSAQRQPVWDVVGDGKTGDSAPGSWGGHAVPLVAYDTSNFTCVTWGGLLKMTHQFHATYSEEAYAVISHDFLAHGRTPQGFNSRALHADLHKLAAS